MSAMGFPERDWKHLSRLKPMALDRLCHRILAEAQALIGTGADGKYHTTYLALYRRIQAQDQVVADCFNDWRRSQAQFLLIEWRRHHLITDEEYAGFSDATRAAVEAWFSIMGEER